MKKLLISVFLLAACRTAPSVPEPAVAVGTTLTTPCMTHGEDVWTVQGVELTFVYSLINQDGEEALADEKAVLEVLLDNQPK